MMRNIWRPSLGFIGYLTDVQEWPLEGDTLARQFQLVEYLEVQRRAQERLLPTEPTGADILVWMLRN